MTQQPRQENRKHIDPVQSAIDSLDADMAERAKEYERRQAEATAQYEQEQERLAMMQQPGIFNTGWIQAPPPPAPGPKVPSTAHVLAPPHGSRENLREGQEGWLSELAAAAKEDPDSLARLASVVHELVRLIESADIPSRSRGLPS